jgi:hypothetical protein
LAERAVLDHREEDRHQDQRMNVDLIIPRTIGAAIGFFFTSRADPLSHRMGARLSITTATVISFGLRRCTAPSMLASSMSD